MPTAVEEKRADQIFAAPAARRQQPDLFGFLRIPFVADEVRPRLIGEIQIIIKIQAISNVARLRNEGHLAEPPRQSQIDKIRSSVVGRSRFSLRSVVSDSWSLKIPSPNCGGRLAS